MTREELIEKAKEYLSNNRDNGNDIPEDLADFALSLQSTEHQKVTVGEMWVRDIDIDGKEIGVLGLHSGKYISFKTEEGK